MTSRLRSPDQSRHDSTCPARTDTLGPRAIDPGGAPNRPSSRAAVARICSSQPVQATTPSVAHSAANRARASGTVSGIGPRVWAAKYGPRPSVGNRSR